METEGCCWHAGWMSMLHCLPHLSGFISTYHPSGPGALLLSIHPPCAAHTLHCALVSHFSRAGRRPGSSHPQQLVTLFTHTVWLPVYQACDHREYEHLLASDRHRTDNTEWLKFCWDSVVYLLQKLSIWHLNTFQKLTLHQCNLCWSVFQHCMLCFRNCPCHSCNTQSHTAAHRIKP